MSSITNTAVEKGMDTEFFESFLRIKEISQKMTNLNQMVEPKTETSIVNFVMETDYVILTGRSNIKLANDIGTLLEKKVECCVSQFSSTESRVQIKQRVNGKNIVIIQTGSNANNCSVNDHLMDTLLIMDACRRSECNKIYLILALYPYSRQDKKTSRAPISARVVGKMIDMYSATVLTLDLHSSQIQGFIDRNFHNFYGTKIFTKALSSIIKDICERTGRDKNQFVLVSPDYGGAARVNEYAKNLKLQHVAMCKLRDNSKPNMVEKSTIPMMENKLDNRTAIVIDDMGDTMGTIISCCNNLKNEYNMNNAIIVLTHGIFSGPAIKRINECDFISKVIVTDTLPQELNKRFSDKIQVVTSASLFAKAIQLITNPLGKGASSMFKSTSMSDLTILEDKEYEDLFDQVA
jgi:ribose-phosphate pyrophosphokinase